MITESAKAGKPKPEADTVTPRLTTIISASTLNARNMRHTYVTPAEDKQWWRVQQMMVDTEGDNDWVAEFEVSLAESRKAGEPTRS